MRLTADPEEKSTDQSPEVDLYKGEPQCVEKITNDHQIDFKIPGQLDSCLERNLWELARWFSRLNCLLPCLVT